MSLRLLILLIGGQIVLAGCPRQVSPPATQAPLDNLTTKQLLQRLTAQSIACNYFEGRAKANISSPEQSGTAQLHLRMIADSLLWLSITKVGVEGGRALLTCDSALTLNRRERTYSSRAIGDLQDEYSLPFSLALAQDLLLGNVLTDTGIVFKQIKENGVLLLEGRGKTYFQRIAFDSNTLLPIAVYWNDLASPRSVSMTLEDRAVKGNTTFAQRRVIQLLYGGSVETEIILQFNQWSFDEQLTITFNIPPAYERLD